MHSFNDKISKLSNDTIYILNYEGSRIPVTAKCKKCGYEWQIRTDHLSNRPYCPKCKKKHINYK